VQATPADTQPSLANFAAEYAWPAERPEVPAFPQRDWLFPKTQEMLQRCVTPATRLIVELGSWLGRSTRFLANLAPGATVIAIDHWDGSPEHRKDPELSPLLPKLYETFLSECWDYRDQIVPVRVPSVEGLHRVAQAGIEPEVIYIDSDHSFDAVREDLTAALDLFPRATIVGDDWDWEGVRTAVETVAKDRSLRFETLSPAWRILGGGSGEGGAGSRDRGAANGEKGAGNGEHGAGIGGWGELKSGKA
jgi:hypothetical protein